MANIFRREGLNRNSEKITYDDGGKKIRCYTKMNPHYYRDETGNLNPIDLGDAKITTTSIGDVTLKSKNIVSLGLRRDDSTEKYLGLRPDETQALGTEQLEFSIESTSFNGEEVQVDLSKNDVIDSLTMDLGDVVVQSNRHFSRQMTKVDRELSDFTIKYKLYLKGLQFQNSSVTKVNETLRPNTNIKSTELGAVQSIDFTDEVYKESNDFEIISAHITNDHLWLTGSPLTGYADIFPDGYSTYRWNVPACAPVSMKDNVVIAIKKNPIGKEGLSGLVKEILLKMTGGTFIDEFTIQKDNKIVAEFHWDTKDDIFWIVIICAEPDYQSFSKGAIQEDLAPIGLTPSAATAEFLTIFNKGINKSEITLNGEYVTPDENDRFTIVNDKGEFKFCINIPKLLNTNFKVVSNQTLHTLKVVGKGIYEYTKYPDLSCFVGAEDVAYIDAEIAYSSTSDGTVRGRLNLNWDTAHDDTVGLASFDDLNYIDTGVQKTYKSPNTSFQMVRGFYFFDTSAIIGDIDSVSLWAYYHDTDIVGTHTLDPVCVQKGTQSATLVPGDVNNFTGSEYGHVTIYDNTWGEIVFNGTGISDIVKGGETKICSREYDHDYLDTAPPSGSANVYACRHRSTDYTATTYDPYLEITLAEAGGVLPIMSVF